MKLKIKQIKPNETASLVDGKTVTERLIAVSVEVYDGEQLFREMTLGFPATISKDELKAELEKVLATLESDKVIGIGSKKVEEENKNAQELNQELSDTEIDGK